MERQPIDAENKVFPLIMQMLHDYYEKPVILLLDEYDAALAKASAHGYYDQMLDMMRAMMSTSVKDNSNLLLR